MLNRRTMIQGAAAAAMLLPTVAQAAPLPARRKPPRLRPGDTVGLVEPAYFTADSFDLDQIQATIRAMGLIPKPAANLLSRHGYLAGTDRERARALNGMFADREVKAIFAVRGGWGSARILPHLDWGLIRANPKLLTGFSDITALHLALAARTDCPTIHGPNASSAWGQLSWDSFRRLAFEGETPTWSNPAAAGDRLAPRNPIRTFRPGRASGPLLGGNLTVLSALVGTPFLPSFEGAILFLEDTDEAQYRIDRMLTQLALSGILGRVAGVVFGQCTDCIARNSSSIGGFTLSEVLAHHLTPLGVPAFQGSLFGHIENQFSIPVGIRAEIDAAEGTIRMLEPVVA
ncbi:MAG TPA: LD-carboxypeptidase [Allosphingosinicella sp.]|nr:LD-carboxypeptidase [Allosphingosinicella sp.]